MPISLVGSSSWSPQPVRHHKCSGVLFKGPAWQHCLYQTSQRSGLKELQRPRNPHQAHHTRLASQHTINTFLKGETQQRNIYSAPFDCTDTFSLQSENNSSRNSARLGKLNAIETSLRNLAPFKANKVYFSIWKHVILRVLKKRYRLSSDCEGFRCAGSCSKLPLADQQAAAPHLTLRFIKLKVDQR